METSFSSKILFQPVETNYLFSENHILLKKLFLQVEATKIIFLWQIVTPALTSMIRSTGKRTDLNKANFYERHDCTSSVSIMELQINLKRSFRMEAMQYKPINC